MAFFRLEELYPRGDCIYRFILPDDDQMSDSPKHPHASLWPTRRYPTPKGPKAAFNTDRAFTSAALTHLSRLYNGA